MISFMSKAQISALFLSIQNKIRQIFLYMREPIKVEDRFENIRGKADDEIISKLVGIKKDMLKHIFESLLPRSVDSDEEELLQYRAFLNASTNEHTDAYLEETPIESYLRWRWVPKANTTYEIANAPVTTTIAGTDWVNAVTSMAEWYSKNIHDYSQAHFSDCDLVGTKVRHDCSGFVSACLWLAGFLPVGQIFRSGDFIAGGAATKKLLQTGRFTIRPYNTNELEPFDIVAKNGHIEIFAGKVDGKMKAYSWGNVHKEEPCAYYKDKYTHILRCSGAMDDSSMYALAATDVDMSTAELGNISLPKADMERLQGYIKSGDYWKPTGEALVNAKTLINCWTAWGWSKNAAITAIACSSTECQMNYQIINVQEYKGKLGWECGEGLVHFTWWKTKEQMIRKFNADSRRTGRPLASTWAEYSMGQPKVLKFMKPTGGSTTGNHICDTNSADGALLGDLFYSAISPTFKAQASQQTVLENLRMFYINKAGAGFAKTYTQKTGKEAWEKKNLPTFDCCIYVSNNIYKGDHFLKNIATAQWLIANLK